MGTIKVKAHKRNGKIVKAHTRTAIGYAELASQPHYQEILGKKWRGGKNERKKKILNYLKRTEPDIKDPAQATHPVTGKIRLAVVRTTPYKYMPRERGYGNKWSKTHTAGGTHISKRGSKSLRNIKKVWGTN